MDIAKSWSPATGWRSDKARLAWIQTWPKKWHDRVHQCFGERRNELPRPCTRCGFPSFTDQCNDCWEVVGRIAGFLFRGWPKSGDFIAEQLAHVAKTVAERAAESEVDKIGRVFKASAIRCFMLSSKPGRHVFIVRRDRDNPVQLLFNGKIVFLKPGRAYAVADVRPDRPCRKVREGIWELRHLTHPEMRAEIRARKKADRFFSSKGKRS